MSDALPIRVVCVRRTLGRYCPASGKKGLGVPEIAEGVRGTLYHGIPGNKLSDVCVLFDGMDAAVTVAGSSVTSLENLQSHHD